MLEVNIRFAGCATSFQTEPIWVDIAETSRFCSMLEINILFVGCARLFRTELIWMDIAETSRFCSMLEEILLSFRYLSFVCRASVIIRVYSFEDSSTTRLEKFKVKFIRRIYDWYS